MSDATIHVHQNRPPFAVIKELTTGGDIDRVMPLDEPGTLSFTVASNDPNRYSLPVPYSQSALAPPPNIREGDAVVVRSSEGIAPYLWIVDTLTDDTESGLVTIDCQEWSSLLYRRQVPLEFTASSKRPTAVAKQLLDLVNGRNPTHIRSGELSSSRLILPDQRLPLGGNTLGAAFDELALRTDSEWWVEYKASWEAVEPILYWAERRGHDRASNIVVDGLFHLTEATYRRDEEDVAQTAQYLGGGDAVADAPAGGISIGSAIATAKPSIGGRIEPADSFTERLALNRTLGPGARRESSESLPSEESETSLVQSSQRRQKLPIAARQSLECQLRYPWPGSTSGNWGIDESVAPLRPGDIITVRLPQALFGRGVQLIARILAMQPDEAAGTLGLVIEVQQGTVQWLRGMET